MLRSGKKLISTWTSGNLKCRLSTAMVNKVSKKIEIVSAALPLEFNRKVRRLEDFSRWKATECRSFLLYVGYFALKDILEESYYNHFMQLSVAISILISSEYADKISLAEKILICFVKNCKHLYGDSFYIHNVHNLIHLVSDVKRYGTLDSFSAFVFENYLGQLIKLVKKGNQPLQQIVNRVTEKQIFGQELPLNAYEILEFPRLKTELRKIGDNVYYKKCIFKEFTIKLDNENKNNTVLLKDNNVVSVTEIYENRNGSFFTGKPVSLKENVFIRPIHSKRMGKFLSVYEDTLITFNTSEVVGKVISFKYQEEFYFSTMFNTKRS